MAHTMNAANAPGTTTRAWSAGADAVQGPVVFSIELKLLALYLALLGLGIVVYYSSAVAVFDSFGALMGRKLIHVAVALVALVVGARVPYSFYNRFRGPLLILCVALLAAPLIPGLGITKYGATRWVDLGFFSFQPGELVKIAFVLYIASFVSRKREELRNWMVGLLPSLTVGGMLFVLLVLEGDLGTALILSTMLGLMLFLGNARVPHLLTVILLGTLGGAAMLHFSPARAERFMCAVQPDECSEDAKWQTRNAQWAFGSGGASGVGLGNGLQTNQGFLLKSQSDFVYAVIGEQLGFLGSALVIAAYLFVFLLSLSIAARAPDRFGRFLALGLGAMISIHALTHMGVTMRLPYLPAKGLCLPLVSAGGSALVAMSFAFGVLLNVSYAGRRELRENTRVNGSGFWSRLKGGEEE